MSEEKKCINNEELCEGKKELTQEELEQVNGGAKEALRMGAKTLTSVVLVGSQCN